MGAVSGTTSYGQRYPSQQAQAFILDLIGSGISRPAREGTAAPSQEMNLFLQALPVNLMNCLDNEPFQTDELEHHQSLLG